jgi:3D (Asp-Asp-Asp) domain-containing protein
VSPLDERAVRATVAAGPVAPVIEDDEGDVLPDLDRLPRSIYADIATPGAPLGAQLGRFSFTRYYVAEESRHAIASPGDAVAIYDDRACHPIATVSRDFARALDMEGTGRLRDGRTINVSSDCGCGHSPCYRTTTDDARWGLGARGEPLAPFRTIAVDPDVVPLGTPLYVPELDGLMMPGPQPWGGFVHDGCVVAVDVGTRVRGRHLDFFVGRRVHMDAFDARYHLEHVAVYRGGARCQVLGTGRPATPS